MQLIVVGLGILEYDGKDYFGKSAVIEYLHQISEYFERTYFFCPIRELKNFKTKLDTARVKPMVLSYNLGRNTLIDKLMAIIRDNIYLAKTTTKETGVIIYTPMIWFTPILPILYLKSGCLVGYAGSGVSGTLKLQLSKRGIISSLKGCLASLFQKVVLYLSDVVLVRGSPRKYKNNRLETVYESQPIVSLYDGFSSRNDNCDDEIVLLYVGKIHPNKGVNVLIKAFCNLLDEGILKNLRLRIVGGTKQQVFNILPRSIESDVFDNIDFLDWIDDGQILAKEYLSSDIVIVPSLMTEGQPRVIDEAMYYGTPVIATNLEYSDSLKNRKNILLIDPYDVTALREAIKEIITSDELKKRLIKNGKRRMNSILKYPAFRQHAEIVLICIEKQRISSFS